MDREMLVVMGTKMLSGREMLVVMGTKMLSGCYG